MRVKMDIFWDTHTLHFILSVENNHHAVDTNTNIVCNNSYAYRQGKITGKILALIAPKYFVDLFQVHYECSSLAFGILVYCSLGILCADLNMPLQ